MAWQYMIPAAAQTTTSLLQYFLRKKRPRFEETPYGKYLMEQSRYGRYSPTVKRGLLGQVSRATGEEAQRATTAIKGGLVSRGLYGSMAGESLMAQPGLQRMRTLGDISKQIELESETSKTGAREAFARGRTQSEEQRRMEESQARTGLLSGLTQAGTQGYQGYQLGKLAGEGDKWSQLATATASGVKIPYYGYRELFGDEKGMPDISEMSEEEAKNAILLWLLSGGGK